MTANIAKLVIFDTWMAGKAMDMLRGSDVIDLRHLQQSDGYSVNEPELLSMHGYQSLPRTELQADYLTNADFVSRMPNLLAVSSTGAGYDMIDVDACTAAGIAVVNQSGANKEAVAEHAFGFILGLSKKIAQADRGMRETDKFDRRTVTGNDILGKTLGIVGLGQIGTRSAEIARAFRMRVIAYDPYVSADECKARGAEKVDFATLFRESDFVTVHSPRTSETLGMIDAAAFALMKPSAYFVNTARGGIHKEDDLLAALEAGQLAGAGLDVWWEEPTPNDHPLLKRNDVIASPHSAGVTHEAISNMREWAADQWIDIFSGRVPPRLINPEVWPKYQDRYAQKLGVRPADLPN
jgi:D-3-phosphoglycerate dehydrogenase